ncbi:MAG TPA: DUF4349 domain-containing protein [Actinomycetes bacterium]|nr:DUF4349 domain-containing protein [Actinomycetes bacterium]
MAGTTKPAGRPSRARRGGLLTLLVAAGLALATACSGAVTSSGSSEAAAPVSAGDAGSGGLDAGTAGGATEQGATADRDASAAEGKPPAGAPDAAGVALVPRDLVVTGSLVVRVKDVSDAAARTRSLATTLGGVVSSERIIGGAGEDTPTSRAGGEHPKGARDSAQLTLRVPTDRADEAMDKLADLGTLLERDLTSEDVTAQVVDVEARVATARASVERVRALLDRADTLGEVVQIESELTRRQADLESLEAQRKRLANLTDLATVNVTLVPPGTTVAAATGGFLGGLRAGWTAFGSAVGVGLTALGAMLPFLVLGALVAIPVRVALRRRARRPAGPPAEDGTPA